MFGILFGSIWSTLLTIIVSLISLFIGYYKYAFTYWKNLNVPTLPPSIPFGNCGPVLLVKTSLAEYCKYMYDKLKPTGKPFAGFYVFAKPLILVLDPEFARQILIKDFPYFFEKIMYCDEENEPLSASILTLNGMKWKDMRSKLTPTFSSGKIKMMFPLIVQCSEELNIVLDNIVKNKEAIDIKDLTGRFTTDVIGTIAFGLECNSLKDPNVEFRRCGKRIFQLTNYEAFLITFSNYFPDAFKYLKLKRLPSFISDFYMRIVSETVEYREKNNIRRKDFMDLLLQLKNQGLYFILLSSLKIMSK